MQPQVPQNDPQPTSRSQLKRMWNAICRRPFMKLSALLLAFVFWSVIIASDPSLVREKTFANATVSVQGVETLRSRGYIVMQDLTSEPITVRMRAEVKQADYDRATASSFAPKLDLAQQISGPGKQQVKFAATYENIGTVISFEPEYIEVDVEKYIPRTIPVAIERAGESAESIWISTPVAEPSVLTVEGPVSLVDKIRRAVAVLPMNSLTADRPEDSLTAVIELQDASGNPVSSPLLRVSNGTITTDSVRIDVQVYPMREIPVSVDSAVTGTPAHGYTMGDVRITPETVLVAAEKEVLDTLDILHVSNPADVSGQSTGQSVTSQLRYVSGLVYSSADAVVVEADVLPAEHVHTYVDLPITVMGLDAGLTAKLSQISMSAVISGKYQNVEALAADDVHLYVDAAGLSEGVHTAEIKCRVDGTEEYTFEAETPRVTLTVSTAE